MKADTMSAMDGPAALQPVQMTETHATKDRHATTDRHGAGGAGDGTGTAAGTASLHRVPRSGGAGSGELPALVVTGLEHAFATRTVLQGVSLRLPAGQTLALVGPSGCGKSTLLHLCAGLLDVQDGEVRNGFGRTAVLFQSPHLLPWKTTLDNIALSLKARGVNRRMRTARAMAMGHALGLDDVALAQFPNQLSGGMQSRAALARALVLEPDLLLLDEPFAALDIGLKAQMHQLLLEQQRTRGLAVLMITHDVTEAITLADRVRVMAASPGRFVWEMTLPVPAIARSEAWVHQHTAALLAQPVVRAAFELPPLRGVAVEAGSGSAAAASPDGAMGPAGAAQSAGAPGDHAPQTCPAVQARGVLQVPDDLLVVDAGVALDVDSTVRRTGC